MNTKTLRQHRFELNLTQREIAKRTGIHPSVLSEYEHGKTVPSGIKLQKIARALGVDANDILLITREAA